MAAPFTTTIALSITIGALLLGASVLLTRASARTGVPLVILLLALGVAAGIEGLGVPLQNYRLSFGFGTVALVMILFDGGLNTPVQRLREGIGPAAVLATAGVTATAALVGVFARLLGLAWPQALLVGAIVSSTDAAAVFSILRNSGVQLRKRVGITLELESGLNDPAAFILTTSLAHGIVENSAPSAGALVSIPLALLVGAAAGVAIGYLGRELLVRMPPPAGGLYPVLTTALALLAFGVPSLIGGSGFLSVYCAALMIGNGAMPYRAGVYRVHDTLAWFSQLTMFLMLGLMVSPSALIGAARLGLGIGLLLTLLARPIVVVLCLLPFRYRWQEVGFIGWVGLRGAVPIVFASYPVLVNAAGAYTLFNAVFFVVVVNILVTGSTVKYLARRLGLEVEEPPAPPAILEVNSNRPLHGGEVISFFIDGLTAAAGALISDLPFPSESSVILLIRGDHLIAPRGTTRLMPGDHVYLLCREQDRDLVQLIFGRPEIE